MGLILVVSEDAIEIETIKGALSVHGWWVTVAGDRQVALQVAADQAPKLVIVDSDVFEVTELVRSFGAANGGPGVLVCAPEGAEASLALHEAGADQMLTKPVDGPRLLEAVQRCLTTPREQHVDRTPASVELLTSEEIFGDVLRELEEQDGLGAEVPMAVPAPPPVAPRAPAARVAPAEPLLSAPVAQPPAQPVPPAPPPSSDALFATDAVSDERPVVSLAGLFDGGPMGDLPQAAPPGPARPEVSKSAGGEELDSLWGSDAAHASGEAPGWQGPERRSTERPWADGGAAPAAAIEPPLAETEEVPEPPSEAPVEEATAEPEQLFAESTARGDEPSAAVAEESSAGPRLPRQAVVIGLIAALLLIVLGVVFLRNPDGGEAAGAPAVEAAPAAESFVVEDLAGGAPAPEPPADAPQAELAEAADLPPAEPEAEQDQIEDLDLQAIVDQELQRREEELRQVFLEEEKRLLRELGNLDREPESEDGEDGDGGRTGGAASGG